MSENNPGFTHIEDYSMVPQLPKKDENGVITKEGRHGAAALFAESEREFASAPHIAAPLPPTLLLGVKPLALLPELRDITANGRTSPKRRVNYNAKLLLAGVSSYPVPWEEINRDSSLQKKKELDKWLELEVLFLKKQWPTELRCVVLHTDEAYPHIHWYCIAMMIGNIVHVSALHPGNRRSAEAGKHVLPGQPAKKPRKYAFVAALRQFQDEHYIDVCAPLGLARFGMRNPRVPRSHIVNMRRHEKAVQHARQEADRKLEEVEAIVRKLQDERLQLA